MTRVAGIPVYDCYAVEEVDVDGSPGLLVGVGAQDAAPKAYLGFDCPACAQEFAKQLLRTATDLVRESDLVGDEGGRVPR